MKNCVQRRGGGVDKTIVIPIVHDGGGSEEPSSTSLEFEREIHYLRTRDQPVAFCWAIQQTKREIVTSDLAPDEAFQEYWLRSRMMERMGSRSLALSQ